MSGHRPWLESPDPPGGCLGFAQNCKHCTDCPLSLTPVPKLNTQQDKAGWAQHWDCNNYTPWQSQLRLLQHTPPLRKWIFPFSSQILAEGSVCPHKSLSPSERAEREGTTSVFCFVGWIFASLAALLGPKVCLHWRGASLVRATHTTPHTHTTRRPACRCILGARNCPTELPSNSAAATCHKLSLKAECGKYKHPRDARKGKQALTNNSKTVITQGS